VALDFTHKEDPVDTNKLELASQILTIAVLSILITAPFRAVGIYRGGPRLLGTVVPWTKGSAASSHNWWSLLTSNALRTDIIKLKKFNCTLTLFVSKYVFGTLHCQNVLHKHSIWGKSTLSFMHVLCMILTLLTHAYEEDEEEYDDDNRSSDMSLHPLTTQLQNKISWPYLWIIYAHWLRSFSIVCMTCFCDESTL